MKQMTGKELCSLLEEHGWKLQNIKGSHHVYTKTGCLERLSVPVHASKPLKKGLLAHLLKSAGIDPK